jgi:glycosyltransferase involved in cell wall biosynthesis
MIKGLHRAMNSTTLAYYRLLGSLVTGKRILDLKAEESPGTALLHEAGNEVRRGLEQAQGDYDLLLALDEFRTCEDIRTVLDLLRDQLSPGGTFVVSCRIATATGVHRPSGVLVFRLETFAKLVQDYFGVITYAFLHGDEFEAEWNQYSDRAVFFCRFLKPSRGAKTGLSVKELDKTYGGRIKGLGPFSLAHIRLWLNQDGKALSKENKGNLLFFLQPLPLYGDRTPTSWEQFCFDKLAEGLDKSPSDSELAAPIAPQIACKTLVANFSALEQVRDVPIRSIAGRKAEFAELQGQLRRADMSREKTTSESLHTALQETRGIAERLKHNNEHLRKQLDAEADKARTLQGELEAARKHAFEVESAVEAMGGRLALIEKRLLRNRLKRGIHHSLDFMQRLVPESTRRAARPAYLEYVYYRVYPERRPEPEKSAPSITRRSNSSAVISSYAPYVDFKERLYGGLPLDFRRLSAQSTKGLVSVVLPVHNGARYVALAIESVLRQTYQHLELIIVDDGSIDDTPRILNSYRHDPRVRIIRQTNQKLPAALNSGFAQAQGEYRTWTSDDNVMLPEMLQELVNFLEHEADVEMVYADQELIDEDGRPLLQSDFCPGYQTPPGGNLICWPRDPGELNFIQNNYFGACFLYRAWAARLVGEYSTALFGFEDYDYWMRMNALFRARHFGQRRSLYRYRVHRTSLSSRDHELLITHRVREFMASETARRAFLAQPFEVAFLGAHPWFREMDAKYRAAGHNILEGQATRKSLTLFGENYPQVALDRARINRIVVRLTDNECLIEAHGVSKPTLLLANSADDLLYPILAAANSVAYTRWQQGSVEQAALQNV